MPIGSNRRPRRHLLSQNVFESFETRTLLSNTAPVLDTIPAIAMVAPAGTGQLPKTIQVPLTATDADGDALTYTVTSSNSSIVPITHAGDPFLKMTVQFVAGVPDVQTLTVVTGATGGQYTFSFGGSTTTALAYNATTASVQAALRLLPGLTGVVVSGSPLTSSGTMIFTFPAASGDVDALTINTASLTTAAAYTVTETTPGVAGTTSEVQTLKGSAAAGGQFTLSFGGSTTTALAYNATTATVQTALRLLSGLSGVVVSGSPLTSTSGMIFTFPATSGNVDTITINAISITPVTSYTMAETAKGIVPGTTGDMWLMLYKEWAPMTVQTITGFLDAGFYDNLIFHRVLKGFMAQGGDPLGTGTGGPGFQFKDEFNQNLIFSNRGQLAMANSGDDTNGSQFFITDVATRWLDFNHTIWGQLVRGFDILDGIVDTQVTDSTNGTPTPAGSMKILSAAIVPDSTDTAITLSARNAGTSTITVTASDGHGGTSVKTFTVTATADSVNDPAFLQNLTDLSTPVDQPITIPLSATDLERDSLAFNAVVRTSEGDPVAHATVIQNGSSLTVVPDKGYTGVITLVVGVNRTINRPSETDAYDTETITIAVGGKPIHARPLGYSAVAGAARTASVATFTSDDANVDAGSFSASINWGDGTALVAGNIVQSGSTFMVTGTHTYVHAGEYPLTVTIIRSALAIQTGSATSVRVLAEVAAAPQAGATATIINAGLPVIARQNVAFWQYGSVASTGGTVSATVNWGDHTGTSNLPLDGNRNFRLFHAYKNVGKFNITVTVNDGSGTPAVQQIVATVLAAGPKAVVSGDNTGITGQIRSVSLKSSDAGSNIPTGNYWYSINWGDGTSAQTTTIGTTTVTHRYWKAGKFNATVRIYDPWGDTGKAIAYPVTITNAMLQTDPYNPKSKALVVGGTQGNDKIKLGVGKKGIAVTVNGKSAGEFVPTGFLYLLGYDGNDTITVDPRITTICSIYGGTGNDTLTGGGGYTILVGGDGNDRITAGAARSVLIGGNGADRLIGGKSDDVLVGGTTSWDNYANPGAALYLTAEWVQPTTTYAQRVAHLSGTTGGRNAGVYLEDYTDSSNTVQQTVFDDGAVDTLTGGSGNDWFLANQTTVVADAAKKDVISDKATGEQVLNVLT